MTSTPSVSVPTATTAITMGMTMVRFMIFLRCFSLAGNGTGLLFPGTLSPEAESIATEGKPTQRERLEIIRTALTTLN
jgi:hypothetical protein